ncbi:Lipase 3 [Lachnellula cervina]|uniref:Carboxylic ester hydrolase n=1 Tax=Lachnellula cervina TaxID=1316786 RepID=A0A7D8UYY5_9HELO|nr:Lipase 3 [Lachnellula cervina]
MPLTSYLIRLVVVLVVVSRVTPAPLSPSSSDGRPIVDLEYSQYQGIGLSFRVNQYLGMRYAAPPLGDLRFRAPVDPLKTSGVQNATSFQAICLATDTTLPSTTQSEDCLFVNVWGPASATSKSKLPVWVYITGGGYTANSNANYNGSTVVANSGQNIVMVNFAYRVGSYGFLASEKVRANGDLNVGLLDQRMAFKWVQQYIEHFGGDPSHVVIHGASAGAGSVALHLTAYGGRDDGLFVGGIGESVFFPAQPQVSELEWQFSRYVNDTGCAGSPDELMCLRSKDLTVLQEANVATPFPGRPAAPRFYWTPTIDGDFIQDYPYRLIEQGRFVKVPIIFGDDTDEGTYFATNASTPADVASFFQNNYPRLTSTDTDAINAQYPLLAPLPEHAAYFPSAAAAYGETTFTCVGNYISQTFATMNDPYKVWNYRVNILQPDDVAAGLGVPHTSETPAIFGLGNVNDDVSSSYSNVNAEIIPVVMDYFISFIRDLSPNRYKFASAPHWESFGDGIDGGRRLKLQTNATVMEKIPQDQVKRCEFWRGLALTMEQ